MFLVERLISSRRPANPNCYDIQIHSGMRESWQLRKNSCIWLTNTNNKQYTKHDLTSPSSWNFKNPESWKPENPKTIKNQLLKAARAPGKKVSVLGFGNYYWDLQSLHKYFYYYRHRIHIISLYVLSLRVSEMYNPFDFIIIFQFKDIYCSTIVSLHK